ncbi:hypothetical protein D5086_020980 [Populus alba]|uniref:Uncharacterized protein n=1 Tax=Populus alba TaxID=43335 RepID=A0ACC4BM57_POPAL
MGNCFTSSKQSMAELAPCDFIKSTPAVHLYGDPASSFTLYLHLALLYKTRALQFTPTNDPIPMVQFGPETVSGSREMMVRFIDVKLPQPPLMVVVEEGGETAALVVKMVAMQHRSVVWHLERMVWWSEDLVTRGGRRNDDPTMGSARMEVRKFGKSYSQLLEVMVEHAQMEERVVFPLLETAERGLCKAANEEHGRDLPIMNGIREDMKSIGVLDTGSNDYREALRNLSTRLKSLLGHSKEHFQEEERDVLPLMEALELGKDQQLRVLEQCIDVMQGTHSHLFSFFIEAGKRLAGLVVSFLVDVIWHTSPGSEAWLKKHGVSHGMLERLLRRKHITVKIHFTDGLIGILLASQTCRIRIASPHQLTVAMVCKTPRLQSSSIPLRTYSVRWNFMFMEETWNKINLNEISHDSASGLVNRVLNMGVLLTEVYVDTVGDPEKYRIKLSESFPFVKSVVAKKAGSLYPVVSGASIVAKVRPVCIQLSRTTSGLGEKQAIYTRTLTVLDVSGP